MERTILAVMLAGSMLASSGVVQAADGTIKFTGNITDTACVVDSSGSDQTVSLGTIPATSFSAAGDTASAQKFNITLSGCPNGTVAVTFGGASDPANADLLKLDSGMTATGVAVRINNADDNSQILINDTRSAKRVTVAADGSAVLNFTGQYQSTAIPVTAGTADATSQFTVLYN